MSPAMMPAKADMKIPPCRWDTRDAALLARMLRCPREREMQDLRYPIGEFRFPETVSAAERAAFIQQIADTPERLRAAVAGLGREQLETPYRPGGWTVRQVVHHLPDSHLNSYVRFKLAVTEDEPKIKGYDEAAWAELEDGKNGSVETSLALYAWHGRHHVAHIEALREREGWR